MARDSCQHRIFYRRINRRHKKTGGRIDWHAFKPKSNEDGVINGPSAYWSRLRCPLEALEGHCELCNRHLAAFRECSVISPVIIAQKDAEDESHFFILHFPANSDEQLQWAKRLAHESWLKILCRDKKIAEEYDDPEISCDQV
ncbi:MAG: hypothetical protein FJ118_10370 [Deltaproteobacteria bacterium]|nr:hypothetical protein [Deltaproteobacteria bacterium]